MEDRIPNTEVIDILRIHLTNIRLVVRTLAANKADFNHDITPDDMFGIASALSECIHTVDLLKE